MRRAIGLEAKEKVIPGHGKGCFGWFKDLCLSISRDYKLPDADKILVDFQFRNKAAGFMLKIQDGLCLTLFRRMFLYDNCATLNGKGEA